MNYLQITIPAADPSLQEMLIALLSSLGYDGFEQQDDALQAFLPEEQFDATALESLLESLARRPLSPHPVPRPRRSPRYSHTPPNARRKELERRMGEKLRTVQVGDFCAVRAHFHTPIPA